MGISSGSPVVFKVPTKTSYLLHSLCKSTAKRLNALVFLSIYVFLNDLIFHIHAENIVILKKQQYTKDCFGKGADNLRQFFLLHIKSFQMNINQFFKNSTYCTMEHTCLKAVYC